MEKDKKILPIWLSAILIILIAANIVICLVNTMETGTPESYISSIFICASCAFAIYYFLGGYKKKAADMFELFSICYALSYFVLIFTRTKLDNMALLFPPVISYGVMSIMAVAKDIGKKKSLCLCAVLIACFVADIIIHAVCGLTSDILGTVTGEGILSSAFSIMVYAKYRDKENRGSK